MKLENIQLYLSCTTQLLSTGVQEYSSTDNNSMGKVGPGCVRTYWPGAKVGRQLLLQYLGIPSHEISGISMPFDAVVGVKASILRP